MFHRQYTGMRKYKENLQRQKDKTGAQHKACVQWSQRESNPQDPTVVSN